jgi:predicted Zn-dependent protease
MRLKSTVLLFVLLSFVPLKAYSAAITLEEEKKYGKQMYLQIANSVAVNNDPYISIYLRTVKEKLETTANPPFPIVFTLIDAPTVDAFASIGGFVYITTGLIAICDKEEEFAGVLSHEFAHISKRHVAKAIEKQKYVNWTTLAAVLAAAIVPGAQAKSAALVTGMGAAQQMSINYTRENEEEADRIGAINADKAGYGGLGTAEFLRKLRMTSGGKTVPQYLLTHPYHDERIIRIEHDWKNSKITADTSFFPYLVARAQILHSKAGLGVEEIWINRYMKNKDDPVNAYAAALIYSSKGNLEESIRTINNINSPYKNIFLGEMLINASRYKEAAAVLKEERNPIARLFLAKAYEGSGDREMAANTYWQLQEYAGTYPDIYNRMGRLLGMMGNEGAGYDYLGRYYMEVGKEDLARVHFEKAINKYGINTKEGKAVLKTLEESFPRKR